MAESTRIPKGYARYASLGSAQNLTAAPTAGVKSTDTGPQGAYSALIQNQHATIAIRWRDDGTNPTTTEGMRLLAGQTLEYDGDLDKFAFIEESAGAVLAVNYYGG